MGRKKDCSLSTNNTIYYKRYIKSVIMKNFDIHEWQSKYLRPTLNENTNESAPGYEHDCAAHVVHEVYGYGLCLEGRHTLVETAPGKAEVTHYDVTFKSGKTVNNIPVNELKVVTSESHTHSKKKKMSEDEAITEGRGDMEDILSIIQARANENGSDEKSEAAEIILAIADNYGISLPNIGDYFE